MAALRPADVDAFVARPDPGRPVILVFGPDAGLVSERVDAVIAALVDDPNDPFSLVKLEGDDVAADPVRLVDEAHTVPLFGGRRAVWVKAGSRNFVDAVEALLGAPAGACPVVIEAGDLRRGAPLRSLCERAATAAALPCYADAERDLARMVDEEMRASSLSIAADARAALISLLGGDRRASRNEVRKLALFAKDRDRVELADVLAVVADASGLAVDAVIDAAFAGQPGEVELEFAKLQTAAIAPSRVITTAIFQAAQLHKAALSIEEGASIDAALDRILTPAQFRRRAPMQAALRTWSSARLERALGQLSATSLELRRQPVLADALAQRALLSIATTARSKN